MFQIVPIKSNVIKKGDNIIQILLSALSKKSLRPKNGDILAIASKVVAVSQGRIVKLSEIIPSAKAKKMRRSRYGAGKETPEFIQLVMNESDKLISGNMLLSVKDGILIAGAGVDMSNSPDGYAILWPKDSEKEARKIMNAVKKKFHLKHFGVVITDSRCHPLRYGTIGLALAFAGFEGICDMRNKKDIYGKPLRVTRMSVADNLAGTALLLMGEAGEKIPFVLLQGAPVKFTNQSMSSFDIYAKPEDCLFSGIYSKKFKNMLK